MAQSAAKTSTVSMGHHPMQLSTGHAGLQPQTLLVNQMGQTFVLAPVSSLQSGAAAQQSPSPFYAAHQPQGQQLWLTSNGDVMSVNVQGSAPMQLVGTSGMGQVIQFTAPPSQPHGGHQGYFITQSGGGPVFPASSASSVAHTAATTSLVQFSVPAAPLSSLTSSTAQHPTLALPAFSAFHAPSKRSHSSAVVLAGQSTPVKPLGAAQVQPRVGQQLSLPHGVRRRQSSSSSSSASSSSSFSSSSPLFSASSTSRLSSDEVDALDALSSTKLLHSPSRRQRDEGDGQTQRIDGMSSSRLLTHISKKPSYVLPFTVHRSQLPGHFESSPASSAPPSLVCPPSPSLDPSQTVTVNIRVMGGPDESDLYFVAADLSQLIHSRKSNIAKAVSVFTDSERARCSVICPRSNQTQSTHILTVLTMDGVRRLLQSSRAAIALPFLAWINAQVHDIIQAGRTDNRRGDNREQRSASSERGQEDEVKVKKARKE
jgi:hypothetical protein